VESAADQMDRFARRARSRPKGAHQFVGKRLCPTVTRGRLVGAKGQVVIPKKLRDEPGIERGDEVTFWREGDHVLVRAARYGPVMRVRCGDT